MLKSLLDVTRTGTCISHQVHRQCIQPAPILILFDMPEKRRLRHPGRQPQGQNRSPIIGIQRLDLILTQPAGDAHTPRRQQRRLSQSSPCRSMKQGPAGASQLRRQCHHRDRDSQKTRPVDKRTIGWRQNHRFHLAWIIILKKTEDIQLAAVEMLRRRLIENDGGWGHEKKAAKIGRVLPALQYKDAIQPRLKQ